MFWVIYCHREKDAEYKLKLGKIQNVSDRSLVTQKERKSAYGRKKINRRSVREMGKTRDVIFSVRSRFVLGLLCQPVSRRRPGMLLTEKNLKFFFEKKKEVKNTLEKTCLSEHIMT